MKADLSPPPELADETSIPSSRGDMDPRTHRTPIHTILCAVDSHDKKHVVVSGCVKTGRKPSSLLAILELNDGSCKQNLQAVVLSQVYKLRRLMPTGTSLVLEGVLEKLDGAKHRHLIELRVERVIEVDEEDAGVYPLPKTKFSLEGLTDLVDLHPRTDKLPLIVLCDGQVINLPDERVEYPAPISLPEYALFQGSTNDWLLLGIQDQQIPYGHPLCFDHYVLHNAFSLEYVPLPELDAVLHRAYSIRKFLMHSTVHDFIAVITTNENTPLIIILPGKGVWMPKPRAAPYIYIVDIAFVGDKLYGLTKADNLIPFDLGLSENGSPMVTMGRRLIRQPLDYKGYEWWSGSDDDNSDLDDDDEEEEEVEDDVDTDDEDGRNNLNDLSCPYKCIMDGDIITWHLIESRGKLLMVKPRMHIPLDLSAPSIRKVELFEADVDKGKWVPMVSGLGNSQALFIGNGFSKSVFAPCGDVAEGDIYFIESGEVFNVNTLF